MHFQAFHDTECPLVSCLLSPRRAILTLGVRLALDVWWHAIQLIVHTTQASWGNGKSSCRESPCIRVSTGGKSSGSVFGTLLYIYFLYIVVFIGIPYCWRDAMKVLGINIWNLLLRWWWNRTCRSAFLVTIITIPSPMASTCRIHVHYKLD